MARTSNIYIRVEPEVKKRAEQVLEQLGIPMSNAVNMFLKQVALQRGIPFEIKLPESVPLSYESLKKEEFDAEITKGRADIEAGRTYTAESIKEEMQRDYGL